MHPGNVISALFVGLLVGALGRLVLPGRQPIGCLLTVLFGIAGAVIGGALGEASRVGALLTFVLQVAVAAALAGLAALGVRRR